MKVKSQKSKVKSIITTIILLSCCFVVLNFVFAQPTKDFIYPLDNPQLSDVSKFGTKRYDNVYHLGDDFLAPAGTKIMAIGNGTVKHIGIHSRFGTVVLVEHELASGKKIVSLYGHLRRPDIQISENQFVNKGEIIGFIGAAGRENGYWPQEHLHLGIHKEEYVDVKIKWVYWGYAEKKELANWYNPSEFLGGKTTTIIDENNLAKIFTIPAQDGRAHLKMFNAKGKQIANSDIYAARFSSYPGGDVAVARTDTEGGRAIIIGLGKKVSPYVKVYNKKDKILISKFLAFPKKYRQGLRVATGDINGDGIDEIIAGSQGKIRPQFKIFDLQGNVILRKYLIPKNNKSKAGLDVAAGDVDGDKIDEIIVSAGAGAKPFIKIFKANGVLIKSFYAYSKNFRGGVHIATADIDRDGIEEIVSAPDKGGGPQVRIFEPDGKPRPIDIFPYDANFRGGVDVAGADFDNDGKDEIITSPASSAQAWIKVYRYNARRTVLANFLAYETAFEGGANITGMK